MLEQAAAPDFPSRVAAFYRGRGYTVHEGVKVRGASGKVYPMRMVAEGAMGALAVSFGDAGGVDEHEVVLVRGLAKDIGATPVLANPSPDASLRRLAAQLAVVLLDDEALLAPPPPTAAQTIRRELVDAHPWPTSGRSEPSGAWPSGTSRAVEVDEWMDNLTAKPRPAAEAVAAVVPAAPSASAPPTPADPAEPASPEPAGLWSDRRDADALLAEPTPPPASSVSSIPTAAPTPVAVLEPEPAPAFGWLTGEPERRPPQLVALEHASTVVAEKPEPGVLQVDLPPALLHRAAAADAAFRRLRWAKRLAWAGLGLLGGFLVYRYVLGL